VATESFVDLFFLNPNCDLLIIYCVCLEKKLADLLLLFPVYLKELGLEYLDDNFLHSFRLFFVSWIKYGFFKCGWKDTFSY
jgi:hypothetical protein